MLWLPMGEEQEHVDWSQQGALSIEAHSRGDTRMERKGLNQKEAEQAKGISRLGKKEAAAREVASQTCGLNGKEEAFALTNKATNRLVQGNEFCMHVVAFIPRRRPGLVAWGSDWMGCAPPPFPPRWPRYICTRAHRHTVTASATSAISHQCAVQGRDSQ